jgi:hypothetical protein
VQPRGIEYLFFEQPSYDECAPIFLFSYEKQFFQPVTHCLDVIWLDDAFKDKVAIMIQMLALVCSQQVHTRKPQPIEILPWRRRFY